ncbi:NAD(P)H-hydrate epimerase [Tenacibaculum adriaticum]|uniref:Bifunctional NAD(P)H-hydrate repair enzyme n=1 Tax=Tenacibaculum adriaticum TaxID=413713 RepID=A0A5S5DJA8_9FLAO|nr:NAD(P)H-hydrate dehydratase [Tenacibaculum adriaticum]TYP96043.1 NAD(P)H-hydrate epimerase [Tenacibaculum adriaticum]
MIHFKKILNVAQIRNTDNYTIKNSTVTSLELMENAANAFVKSIENEDIEDKKIVIVCGVGNNGGDGLAISRILKEKGIVTETVLVKFKETLSPDCAANLKRLHRLTTLYEGSTLPDFSNYDIIIDAIFGSGLSKPVQGFIGKVIEAMNDSKKIIFSVDIPSGMYCDTISDSEFIVKSDLVITFQRPKFSFFFPENAPYVKNWTVANIGLDEEFIQSQEANEYLLDTVISKHVKVRERQSHKGSYGHALIIAGSYGKMGASVLASKACLRSGVGLLTMYIPKCGYDIIQTSVPEAMCITDENSNFITQLPNISKYSAIGIGPGIDKNSQTVSAVKQLLEQSKSSIVIDADAINILSENKELIKLIPKNSILTPHIKEFDRLVGESKNSLERFQKQREFSAKNNCIIVLKNAYTSISFPDGKLFFNSSGNQGMATGGSGDVLTGIITSLLAQHYTPGDAALIGVFFHGKAGDKAAIQKGYSALIASDIIDNIRIEKN